MRLTPAERGIVEHALHRAIGVFEGDLRKLRGREGKPGVDWLRLVRQRQAEEARALLARLEEEG